MKKMLMTAAVFGLAAMTTPAQALLNIPVAANAYITFGNLDWAWAAPCAPEQPSCGGVDLTYQGTQGWRVAVAADFANGPLASDFIFRGANVPQGGASAEGTQFFGAPGDGACAAAYFSSSQNHCDYNDGNILAIFNHPNNPFPGNGAVETWVVRGNAIPEPASWALMILGFGLAGSAVRRRDARTVLFA